MNYFTDSNGIPSFETIFQPIWAIELPPWNQNHSIESNKSTPPRLKHSSRRLARNWISKRKQKLVTLSISRNSRNDWKHRWMVCKAYANEGYLGDWECRALLSCKSGSSYAEARVHPTTTPNPCAPNRCVATGPNSLDCVVQNRPLSFISAPASNWRLCRPPHKTHQPVININININILRKRERKKCLLIGLWPWPRSHWASPTSGLSILTK